jgi:hypothetical protein
MTVFTLCSALPARLVPNKNIDPAVPPGGPQSHSNYALLFCLIPPDTLISIPLFIPSTLKN